MKKLRSNGFQAFLVGGSVRDFLLGIEPHDYDVATNALPEEVLKVFRDQRVISEWMNHGTVTVIVNGERIETTTFRSDGEYVDQRHPLEVKLGVSLIEDLKRRDFTINAIACDEYGKIYDPFCGVNDLKDKIIRCVGNADMRFGEDALRIMRALRFAAVYGFDIEEQTGEAIHNRKQLLDNIAIERIFSEFSIMLCGKYAGRVILGFSDVLSVFIPQLEEHKGFYWNDGNQRQNSLKHLSRAVDAVSPVLTLRLAMFFHDIAKPLCTEKTEKDYNNNYSIYAQKSSVMAARILKSLKAPSKLIKSVETLIKYQYYDCDENRISIKRLMRKIGAENVVAIFKEIRRADILAQDMEDHSESLGHIERCAELCSSIVEKNDCISVSQLDINGNDLISVGFENGRNIGLILERLLDEVIEEKVPNQKQRLLERAQSLQKTGQ